MPFETDDPVTELRKKARETFPTCEALAHMTYLWLAADEIERLQRQLELAEFEKS